MRKTTIIFFLLIQQLTVLAQSGAKERIENTRFEIMKTTIEYLANDQETFGKIPDNKCKGCTTTEDLIKFVNKNKLAKVDTRIRTWEKVQLDTTSENWEASLNTFKEGVIKKITEEPHTHRTEGPAFKKYRKTLDSLVTNTKPFTALPKTALAQDTGRDSVPDNMVNSGALKEPAVAPMKSYLAYLAFLPDMSKEVYYFIILILAVALIIFLWRLRNRSKLVKTLNSKLDDQSVQLKKDSFSLEKKEEALQQTAQKLADSERKAAKLEEELIAERERNERLPDKAAPTLPETNNIAPPITKVIKYARYADQGDGFSDQELLDKESSDTIFELIIVDNKTAFFKVSDNPDAQQYALSNTSYFLGKTSHYDHFPTSNSSIQTVEAGELKLKDTKWVIVKPIKISFN